MAERRPLYPYDEGAVACSIHGPNRRQDVQLASGTVAKGYDVWASTVVRPKTDLDPGQVSGEHVGWVVEIASLGDSRRGVKGWIIVNLEGETWIGAGASTRTGTQRDDALFALASHLMGLDRG